MSRVFKLLLLVVPLWLAGCDLLGIEGASVLAARREAEGKAVGAACRHAGRAIEDCYALNRRAEKAAMFAGWREMNDYMADNKIDVVRPQGSGQAAVAAHDEAADEAPAGAEAGPKGGAKGG